MRCVGGWACFGMGSFNIYNLNMPPWGLASDFPEGQRQAVTELLLGAPLKCLENQGLIRFKEHSNYVITPSGHKAVQAFVLRSLGDHGSAAPAAPGLPRLLALLLRQPAEGGRSSCLREVREQAE